MQRRPCSGELSATFTAGTIDSGTFIDIRSNGLTSLGTLNAGDYIDLRTGGGIQLADATSGETIYILTGGTLNGGDLTAGNTVAAQGANGITLGNLSAGIVNPSSVTGARYAVGLGSNGAINVGNITAAGDIGMGTVGTVTTGNLISGGGILAIVGGNMQFGSMTTDADGYIYLADASMAALGGTFDNFDRGPVLAATPSPPADRLPSTDRCRPACSRPPRGLISPLARSRPSRSGKCRRTSHDQRHLVGALST